MLILFLNSIYFCDLNFATARYTYLPMYYNCAFYIFFYFLHSLCRECLLRLLLVYIVIKCPLCRTIVNPKCLMNKQPKNSVKTSKKIWTSLMKSQRFGNVRTTKKTKKKRSCWLLK